MGNQWPALGTTEGMQVWREVLIPVGSALVDETDPVTAAALEAMRLRAPEVFSDPQMFGLVRASTEVLVARLGHTWVQGSDPRDGELPGETVVALQSAVRMQLGLGSLLRLFSLAHELVWEWVFNRIASGAQSDKQLSSAASVASPWLFAFIDNLTSRLASAYDHEREAWFNSALAERSEAIAAILDGRERDAAAASRRLRYDLRRHHVGVCLWISDPKAVDPQANLNATMAQLALESGVHNTLVSPFGSHALRGWLTRSRPFSAMELSQIKPVTTYSGVVVALGSPGFGLEGFRKSQMEAAEVRRLIAADDPDAPLVHYRDVAAAALATVDREQAAAFVQRVLGPLADPDPATQMIAETLEVYLAESGNRQRAGKRLIVHPNTVTYRVRKAEELLGRSVLDDTLDLRLALTVLPYVRERR